MVSIFDKDVNLKEPVSGISSDVNIAQKAFEESDAIKNVAPKASFGETFKESTYNAIAYSLAPQYVYKAIDYLTDEPKIPTDTLKQVYPQYPEIYEQPRTSLESEYLHNKIKDREHLEMLYKQRDAGFISQLGYGVVGSLATAEAYLMGVLGKGSFQLASRFTSNPLTKAWLKNPVPSTLSKVIGVELAENLAGSLLVDIPARTIYNQDNYGSFKGENQTSDYITDIVAGTIIGSALRLPSYKKLARNAREAADAKASKIDPEILSDLGTENVKKSIYSHIDENGNKITDPTKIRSIDAIEGRKFLEENGVKNPLTGRKSYKVINSEGENLSFEGFASDVGEVSYQSPVIADRIGEATGKPYQIHEVDNGRNYDLDSVFDTARNDAPSKLKKHLQNDDAKSGDSVEILEAFADLRNKGYDGVEYTTTEGRRVVKSFSNKIGEIIKASDRTFNARESDLLSRRFILGDEAIGNEMFQGRQTQAYEPDSTGYPSFGNMVNGKEINSPKDLNHIIDPYRRAGFLTTLDNPIPNKELAELANKQTHVYLDELIGDTLEKAEDIASDLDVEKAQLSKIKDSVTRLKEADDSTLRKVFRALSKCIKLNN